MNEDGLPAPWEKNQRSFSMNAENRRWITVREAAEYLKISVKGTYDMAAAGKLPPARVGRLVRIDGKALEEELERQLSGRKPGGGKTAYEISEKFMPSGRKKSRAK
jgi:excisionase family DNA binding protein